MPGRMPLRSVTSTATETRLVVSNYYGNDLNELVGNGNGNGTFQFVSLSVNPDAGPNRVSRSPTSITTALGLRRVQSGCRLCERLSNAPS